MFISKQVMEEVRQRLSDPANWNRNGSYHNGPNCSCLVGMIVRVSNLDIEAVEGSIAYKEMESDIRARYQSPADSLYLYLFLEDWNDNIATHEELLALLDRQIARMA